MLSYFYIYTRTFIFITQHSTLLMKYSKIYNVAPNRYVAIVSTKYHILCYFAVLGITIPQFLYIQIGIELRYNSVAYVILPYRDFGPNIQTYHL